MDETTWEKIYLKSFLYTKGSKLRNFQFKLLHRRIPTNKFLYTIKVKDNSLCTFWKTDIETLIHIFWSCEIVQTFWRSLEKWFQSNLLLPRTKGIDKVDAVGLSSKSENISIGFCKLAARYYIFKNKLQEKIPSISEFLKFMKHEIIGREFRPENEFYSKWKSLQTHSQQRSYES